MKRTTPEPKKAAALPAGSLLKDPPMKKQKEVEVVEKKKVLSEEELAELEAERLAKQEEAGEDFEEEEDGEEGVARATSTTPPPFPSRTPVQRDEEEETNQEITDPSSLITNFRVSKENVAQLAARGIKAFFPIQKDSFNAIFEGKDLLGRAKTGSGKTVSFVLPTVERMAAKGLHKDCQKWGRPPKVLCIAPTRELARQNAEEFERCTKHLGMKVMTVYGGAPIGPMCGDIRRGIDILVGTPGRIIDLMDRNALSLASIQYAILDEADEMLSFGFAEDVEKIMAGTPQGEAAPQTLLFSATIPDWVRAVVSKYLRRDHVEVDLIGSGIVNKIPEGVKHLAICCTKAAQTEVLKNVLRVYGASSSPESRTMVFTPTKREADTLSTELAANIKCNCIHGDLSQPLRESTLKAFRDGKFSVLIATDVAARGLDISGVDRVIMAAPSKEAESYIHRAGRTGRAGRDGVAITLYGRNDARMLRMIEKVAGIKFKRVGAPQANSLVKAATADLMREIAAVPATSAERFKESAKKVAEECGGAIEALAKCLARMARTGAAAKDASLLGGIEGNTTVFMQTTRQLPHKGVALSLLREYMPFGVNPAEVTMVEGGAIFDVPHEVAQELFAMPEAKYGDIKVFTPIDELPEEVTIPTMDDISKSSGRGYGNNRSGGGYGGGNRSWGNGGGNRRFSSGGNGGGNRSFGGGNRSYGGGRRY